MSPRWLRVLAMVAAAGASAAAVGRILLRLPTEAQGRPTEPCEEPAGAAPTPPPAPKAPEEGITAEPAAEGGLPPPAVAAGAEEGAAPAESAGAGRAVALPETAPAGPEAAGRASEVPPAPEGAEEAVLVSARESAVLRAYDLVEERAQPDETVEILGIGDVQAEVLGERKVGVAVPLQMSRRAPQRVPRTERAVLQVVLDGAPGQWSVATHWWE